MLVSFVVVSFLVMLSAKEDSQAFKQTGQDLAPCQLM
jgi:hypothetical protein